MKNTLSRWFQVKADLSRKERLSIGAIGLVIILGIWHFVTASGLIPKQILPNPFDVLAAFPDMLHPVGDETNPAKINALHKKDLLFNFWYSVKINIWGIMEAVALSIPIGLAIGLFAPLNAIMGRFTENLRYLPLTAVIGLFVVNFGVGMGFKAHFLAAGIFVYLMPAIAKLTDEVKSAHKNTARTLGASEWELVKTVYFPAVMQKSKATIINLMAVSWTYIIIAENYIQENGVGMLAWKAGRARDYESMYAILVVIFVAGLLQDWTVKGLFKGIGHIWKRYFNMQEL